MRKINIASLSLLVACTIAACGGGEPASNPAANAPGPTTPSAPVALDKNDYPVFPDADAGADPTVSAELGGRGFTGEGWETNTDYELIGDPRAVKGGVFREYQLGFPGTLRIDGPESNTALNCMIGGMVYESLLTIHPTTLDYIPVLATHWQVSDDGATYRYRIDPNARWADGQPVTADDVVATWNFLMDKGLQSPSSQLVYGKFENPSPRASTSSGCKAKCRTGATSSISRTMTLFPAHVLKDVDGAKYLEEYNFKLLPGTGAVSRRRSGRRQRQQHHDPPTQRLLGGKRTPQHRAQQLR